MQTSNNGIDLIKKYEKLRLTAYKNSKSDKFYSIGYGHYSKDINPDMIITKDKAEEYLNSDIKYYEIGVKNLRREFNQNQFDALVSFAYDRGIGNLKKLCKDRTIDEIGDEITKYGEFKRRVEEQELYKKNEINLPNEKIEDNKKDDSYKVKISIKNLNIRKGPGTNYAKTGKFTGPGVFIITETQPGIGVDNWWGKLKSGGWISLKYCEVLK